MWHSQRVGVVVPAFNEALRIRATLARIPSFVDRIYIVDDGSADDTLQQAAAFESAKLVRIRHHKNSGVGAAIVSGYQRAIRDQLDVVAVMAGDGQMAPEDLEGLLLACQSADYVKGNRFTHPERRRMPILRRTGSSFLSWLTRFTTRLAVDDCQCGYTVLRVATAARLPLAELWPRYGYPNDLLALLAAEGARVGEVPVQPVYQGEASGLHVGHLFSIASRILRRGWSLHPVAEPRQGLIRGR
jgi:glycosyltransferase involved in cell wall biosynthesis